MEKPKADTPQDVSAIEIETKVVKLDELDDRCVCNASDDNPY